MNRRTTILVSSAAAFLFAATSLSVRAEEVEGKFRLGFSLGTYGTGDSQHSPSANRRTLFLPNGEFEDRIYDPRNDSAAISEFGINSQPGALLTASYAFTRFWYIEASAGYRSGTVGNVEVQAQYDGVPIPTVQQFNFKIYNLDGGTITQIPVQISAGYRFRPKAAFNPYVFAGVGYSFNSFEPSDELNDLSLSLDRSTGAFAVLQGTQAGGESFGPVSSPSNLSGIVVDAGSAPEWHLGGGLEYSFHSRWVVFLDARYSIYSGKFGMTVNGSNELGISVPSDQRVITDPDALGPFGAVQITEGGLIDGGSFVPKPGAPLDTNCALSAVNCELTGPLDGIKDPGYYYVHAGSVRYDGLSLQIGVKFTF